MRRILACLVAVAAVVTLVAVSTAGGADGNDTSGAPIYDIRLDNAFGLTADADFRVAGVKVGSVSDLDVDAETAQAVAEVTVDKPAFGGLRSDVSCEVRPQSLIGEYFLDCQPGTSAKQISTDHGLVPVERTSGTVPPDLVQSVLTKPYRERLTILISELGAGFAARGGDVNATIQRAIPALRETDKVLSILSDERATLRQLTRDSATVLGNLDENRDQVARFVTEAGDAAEISARRRTEVAGTVRRLPAFETQLRPTLERLGAAARAQTPALRNLRLAAPQLTGLLNRLGPFADASRPAIRALGQTSKTGIQAVQDVRPTVAKLRKLAQAAKQPVTNLRFVLEALDNRDKAVEPNAESPGGKGFTGLEALMQYFFVQSQAINVFDDRGYFLKLGLLVNDCSQYTNGATALANPDRTKRCSAALGDGGKLETGPATAQARQATTKAASKQAGRPTRSTATATTPAPATSGGEAPAAGSTQTTPAPQGGQPALPGELDVPGVGKIPLGDLLTGKQQPQADPQAQQGVLDFLLGS